MIVLMRWPDVRMIQLQKKGNRCSNPFLLRKNDATGMLAELYREMFAQLKINNKITGAKKEARNKVQ